MKRPTDEFWNQLQLLDQKLDSLDYYALLSVDREVDQDTLQKSYERQVRVLHPDRHARESDKGRQRSLTRLYARVGEAFHTLSHPQRRGQYNRDLAAGKLRFEADRTDAVQPVQRDPHHSQARSLYEQAQILLAQGDKRGARAKLQLASQYQPDSQAIAEAMLLCEKKPSPAPVAPPQPEPKLVPALSPAAEEFDEAPPSRAHKRAPLGQSIQVTCKDWPHVQSFYMHNISRGGMLLRCKELLDVGSIVDLGIRTPDGEIMELPAEVVRHVDPLGPGQRPGVGLRFLLIPDPVRERFESLLASAGLSTSSPPPVPPIVPKEEPLADIINSAQTLIEGGDPGAAYQLLEGPIAKHPDNQSLRANFHLAAGLVARIKGHEAEAHEHFARALRYDSDSPLILRCLRDHSS